MPFAEKSGQFIGERKRAARLYSAHLITWSSTKNKKRIEFLSQSQHFLSRIFKLFNIPNTLKCCLFQVTFFSVKSDRGLITFFKREKLVLPCCAFVGKFWGTLKISARWLQSEHQSCARLIFPREIASLLCKQNFNKSFKK